MGFLKSIGNGLKGFTQGAINFVTSPFKSATSSIANAAASGATEGLLEKLAGIGITQEFISTKIGPALEGVSSVGELVNVVKPWVGTVAVAGTSLSYVVMGYLILNFIKNSCEYFAPPDYLGEEMRATVKSIEESLKVLENNSQFQTLVQIQQLGIQTQTLRQQAAANIQKFRPAKLRRLKKDDKARLEKMLKESQAIVDKPMPIILSEEIINAVNVAMTPYLRALFAIPPAINSTETLLNAVSSRMNFESAITAFVSQDFSQLSQTTNDAMNFGYLNKMSNGVIGTLTEKLQQNLTAERGHALVSAVTLELNFNWEEMVSLSGKFKKFNHAIKEAQQLATSEKNLTEPYYKHNVSASIILLALQYRKIKEELLEDKDFRQFLNCNEDKNLIEQVTTVILNRALLGMAVELSKEYTFRKGFVQGLTYGVVTGALATPAGPVLAAGFGMAASGVVHSRVRNNLQFRAGQLADNFHYYKCRFFNTAPSDSPQVSEGVKRGRELESEGKSVTVGMGQAAAMKRSRH